VRLSDTGVAGSQYINANYIHGYGDKEGQYIATQGPTGNTLADFWRMVWEKDVSIIVMTTSLVENGTQKCVKYWPGADDMDTVAYGNMVVRNNYEEVTESYTTSYLSIYPQSPDGREMGEERDVYHFWHTAWCDFGVPRETGSTLRLREAVDAFRAPTSGPVLVHCSAGLGRSGTFMAIDMGIQQYEAEGVVDPLKCMCEMRQDRGGIIQTADQYIYIHRALRDYITTL
jgi:protein tyrosine phosphatase